MELKNISENTKAFQNLFNLYCYELSFTDPWLGTQINENGEFGMPPGMKLEGLNARVIYEDNHAIGFVIYQEGGKADYSIEEIFVTSAYRKKGTATKIVNDYLKDKEGTFMVHILKKSEDAQKFFLDIFKKNDLPYTREPLDEIADCWYVELKK